MTRNHGGVGVLNYSCDNVSFLVFVIFATFLETKIFPLYTIRKYNISLIFVKNPGNAINTGFPLHDAVKDWWINDR